MKLYKILILLSFLGLLTFGFIVWRQKTFSKEVLKLEILGPTEVTAGEEIEYLVKYKNNGNFRLENPELIFEFPENSLSNGEFLERKILKEELGEAIYPGEERTFSFRVRLFGKEGEIKTAKVSLSYRPKNLKARYVSETSFTTKIKSVPFTFEFDLPSQIEPQKVFSFKILYFSNIDSVLENLRIQADWPSGFEFLDSSLEALEQREWKIPILNKFEGGRIEISGKIYGEVGETKIFRARLGIIQNGNFVVLKETEKGLQLVKPSIFVRQEINGNPEYVASPGEWLHYEIYFKNIGEEDFKNLFLICKLEGDAFDFETIKSETGNYQPGDNSIVFDWKKNPKLQLLEPMEEGKVEFWIKLKEALGRTRNPFVKNKILISQVREEFETKISSKLLVSQKGFFEDEVFGNLGPLPPEVGATTTYTIIWKVESSYSKFKDLKLKAILPDNVSLTGKVFPESEVSKFSFDQDSREILWTVDELNPEEIKSLAFQIAFSPTKQDRGEMPTLINELSVSGQDTWSEKTIEVKAKALTTFLKEDPSITEEKAIVQ
jgi:hypothetical protein